MSERLRRFLGTLDGPLAEEDLEGLNPGGKEDVEALEAATADAALGPWGRVAAVRLLARARGEEAVAALCRILKRSGGPDDRLAAEAMVALEGLGVGALASLIASLSRSREGSARELVLEVALRIAGEYEIPPEQTEALRALLERYFRHARHPGDRALYAGYLGDLGEPSAVPVLLEGLRSAGLTRREYEAIQEAVERLGEECPDYYFDREGRGYPMDEEGRLYCLVCGEALEIDPDTSRPAHRDGSPASH